jgi:CheY-like chemotaxis protein
MPGGGPITISAGAVAVSDHARPECFLSVEDVGSGMPPEVLARIFEPFFTTKPRGEGTGLGLAITHAIIKDHDGRIEVISEPARGSTFTVVLPRIDPPATLPAGAPAQTHVVRGKGQTLVLVSGHTYIRELMASTLQSFGYRVVQLPDLSSIRAAITAHSPRMALVDLNSENLQTAFQEAREACGEVKVIYLVPGVHSLVLPPGSQDLVLAKPFQIPELTAAVTEALK